MLQGGQKSQDFDTSVWFAEIFLLLDRKVGTSCKKHFERYEGKQE